MGEMSPERLPGTQELTKMVYGDPLNDTIEAVMLSQHYDACLASYRAADERGDTRAIDEAEQRLTALLEAHPELRRQD